jgi:hypothetical protein
VVAVGEKGSRWGSGAFYRHRTLGIDVHALAGQAGKGEREKRKGWVH